jgi:energy-converting hydrogenase Eha subunit E
MVRVFFIGMLLLIIGALATALVRLMSGKGDSDGTVKALTWRISLSIAMLILLLLAYKLGLITPNVV